MNAEDELSDMEISDDDDDNGGGGGGVADRMKVNYCVDDDDDKILSMIKQPPSSVWNNVFEEFDTRDACLVELDGHKLKKNKISSLYRTLLRFSYACRRKSILEDFSCPGQKDADGGITSWEGRTLERRKHCYKIAKKAITKYNRLNKDGKLKLEKLIKVNTTLGLNYYMTFSAMNRDTGKSGIYQAALASRGAGAYVLGLFRDWSNDKILAILSITGAEEDLAAIRKMSSGRSERS